MFVLPAPLWPHSTVKPAPSSSRAWSKLRKPSSSSVARRTDSDLHRHHDAEQIRPVDGLDGAGIELALELERDVLAVDDLEDLDQVPRVEAGDERIAVVADGDLLVRDTEVRIVRGELQLARCERDADRRGLLRRHDLGTTQRGEQLGTRDLDATLVRRRNHRAIRRELDVVELDAHRELVGLDEQVLLADRDADVTAHA